MEEFVIRPVASPSDLLACQEVQRRAWGVKEEGYLIPVATMAGAAHHGGLVLAAFAPSGEIVAFNFAFLGRSRGKVCLYSQLTGVIPAHQGSGLGRRLKLRQREFAKAEGLEEVVWAFDPFKAGNARFNLEILGATASEYVVDMYGPRTDELNSRLTQTDRLIAHWPVEPAADRPEAQSLDWSRAPVFQNDCEPYSFSGCQRFLLPITSDPSVLQAYDRSEQSPNQLEVRAAFLKLFEQGYVAVGFASGREGLPAGSFYLFERLP
jgi:predicted GNAT superfamily acetyltransferase